MQRGWSVLIFLSIVVSPLVAIPSDGSSFVLKDSGFQASSQHRIYWLDNDRVIFTGYEINLDKLDNQGRYGRDQNIYIWDTREKHRSIYVRNASLGCYFLGYIRYSILDGPSKKGPMRQERTYLDMYYSKETWESEPPDWEEGVKMHPITCRSYRSRGMPADFVELLPEHGYLDFRRPRDLRPGNYVPILWNSPGASEGARLPLVSFQVDSESVRYELFLNGYVMWGATFIDPTAGYETSLWPKDRPYSVWVLFPDGRVHELKVPYQDWMQAGSRGFYPTQKGVFAWTHSRGRHKEFPGDAGAYWIRDAYVQKVISEEIAWHAVRVSPDGCKVAFVSEPYENHQPNVKKTALLHVLEVCKGE